MLRAHDGDERRANLFSDGRVSCVICGTVCHELAETRDGKLRRGVSHLPMPLRSLLADLISSNKVDDETFKLLDIEWPGNVEITTERAAAAVAHGYDGDVFDQTAIRLGVPPYAFQKLDISYRGSAAEKAFASKPEQTSDLHQLLEANPPQGIRLAAEKLVKHGFQFVSLVDQGHTTYQPCATFIRAVSEDRAQCGIAVTLRWLIV
jgi:hypothetical protein